jgi:hypothetical protein
MGIDTRIRAFQRRMHGELQPSRKRSASSPAPLDAQSSEPRKGSMPPPRPDGFGSATVASAPPASPPVLPGYPLPPLSSPRGQVQAL